MTEGSFGVVMNELFKLSPRAPVVPYFLAMAAYWQQAFEDLEFTDRLINGFPILDGLREHRILVLSLVDVFFEDDMNNRAGDRQA